MLRYARVQLRAHLPLHAQGYVCTTNDVLDVLLGVTADRGTIESVWADLEGMPDPETIRGYLNEQLRVHELDDLKPHVNAALASQVPPRVW